MSKSAGKCHYVSSRPGRLHALIMRPKAGFVVDHINHDTLDKRRENLRVVHPRDNALNRGVLAKNNTTGFTGVYKHKYGYMPQIGIGGKTVPLGICKTIREAIVKRSMVLSEISGCHI